MDAPAARGRPRTVDVGPGVRREAIMEAALRLFATQGFHATGVRQIARTVGVTDSALYAHFATKQAILDELFAAAGRVDLDSAEALEELGDLEPAEALSRIIAIIVRSFDREQARLFTSLALRDGLDLAIREDPLAIAVVAAQQRLLPIFQGWQARKLLPVGVSAAQALWESLFPMIAIRAVYFRATSTEADRRRGRLAAQAHARCLGLLLGAPGSHDRPEIDRPGSAPS